MNAPLRPRKERHDEIMLHRHSPPRPAALALPAGPARAAWPERPITMIVPFAAGGPTDVVARIVAEHMSRTLGQQIVIENVAGAGGTTGITRGAQAAPDGYTIMMGHMGTHGAAPAVYPDLKYDPTKDFAPVGLAAGTPIVIVARKNFPAKDLKEFVAYARANGDEAQRGPRRRRLGLLHDLLAPELDPRDRSPTRVVYRGTGPALNDLVSGQVDYMCDQIVNLVPQIQAGTIKAYAVALPAALAGAARRADHEGGRPARVPGDRLERHLRAQGHAARRSSPS